MAIRTLKSGSNWNLEMLVFEERGKPEYPEKNLSEQRRQATTKPLEAFLSRGKHTKGIESKILVCQSLKINKFSSVGDVRNQNVHSNQNAHFQLTNSHTHFCRFQQCWRDHWQRPSWAFNSSVTGLSSSHLFQSNERFGFLRNCGAGSLGK